MGRERGRERDRERERKRATDQECEQSERQSIGQIWKCRGSEMAVSEIDHLSIFSNANQQDK
jgi:hypothetical protein